MKARVLIIAGSDSGGGAGIQADLKTMTAFGVYGSTAITAITVQDTVKVHEIVPVPVEAITSQIRVVLNDIGADVIKIGMLGSVGVGEAVLAGLKHFDGPVVADPVLVATSGDALAEGGVAVWLRNCLVPRATVLTPNVPEAALLSGIKVTDEKSLERAAHYLRELGAGTVCAKGGHLSGRHAVNIVAGPERTDRFSLPRLGRHDTHGTGCTLASAIAANMALGHDVSEACRIATLYVHAAIDHAPGFGNGHGPLNHALRPLTAHDQISGFVPIES